MLRSELEAAVYSYLHRASFRTPVPDFDAVKAWVQFAEADINLDLRANANTRRVSQAVDDRYIPLPCDFIEMVDLRLSTGRELRYMDRHQIGNQLQLQNGAPNVSGLPAYPSVLLPVIPSGPLYYAMAGADLLELWPWEKPPDPLPENWQPYTLEMSYYASQSLGPDPTDTTQVLTQLPTAYLWGALKYSAPFLRDDPRIGTWSEAYGSVVAKANMANERAGSAGSRIVQRFRSTG